METSRDRIVVKQRTSTPASDGLRAPGWLSGRPAVGITLFLIGMTLFVVIAYNVWTNGPLIQRDVPLARQLYANAVQAPHWVIEYLTFGFFAGKELLQVMVVILGLYFFHKRFWTELAMLLIGSGGGLILWSLLIRVFDRPRPDTQLSIVLSDASFPSGHAITSVICYGFLAYLLVPQMPSLFWKWTVGIVSILVVLFIGYSRLFLGGHYLTDVLAGYGLGLAWAGLVFTVIEKIFLKRKMGSAR